MTRTLSRLFALPLAAILVAACGSGASPSPTTPPATATPTAAASVAPTAATTAAATSAAPSPTANACSKDNLKTLIAGKLTIGTDNPAYEPYFEPDAGGTAPKPWEAGNPANGQGFESAVAYAVAGKLGFAKTDVTWVPVKFDNSYTPGAKPFDFYLAQVSYTPDRAQAVDMSDGYYYVAQAVVALKGTPIADVKTISGLKGFKLGAMKGTTSYDAITNTIQPTKTAAVYNNNDLAVQALKNKQVDGIVTDAPTAYIIMATELDNGVIVGQLPVQQGPDAEHFSLVLAKGSPLTQCVNGAIASLKADGTLDGITKEWLADKANAPVLNP